MVRGGGLGVWEGGKGRPSSLLSEAPEGMR